MVAPLELNAKLAPGRGRRALFRPVEIPAGSQRLERSRKWFEHLRLAERLLAATQGRMKAPLSEPEARGHDGDVLWYGFDRTNRQKPRP